MAGTVKIQRLGWSLEWMQRISEKGNENLGQLGYTDEFNPVAGNDTAEGKARNRRTEIIITPKLDQFMDLIDQAPDNSSSGIVGDENTKE